MRTWLLALLLLFSCSNIPEGCEERSTDCELGGILYDCRDPEKGDYLLLEMKDRTIEIHYNRKDILTNAAIEWWMKDICVM